MSNVLISSYNHSHGPRLPTNIPALQDTAKYFLEALTAILWGTSSVYCKDYTPKAVADDTGPVHLSLKENATEGVLILKKSSLRVIGANH